MTPNSDTTSAVKRCCQCGRVGTRGFVVTEESTAVWPHGGKYVFPSITFCANTTACRKRWPKRSDDDEQ